MSIERYPKIFCESFVPIPLVKLLGICDALLQPQRFDDYCPNGLQVEGVPQVQRLISGVTASQGLIDRAIAAKADALLVHHGYFWHGESAAITGMKYRRIKKLIDHGINLIAYHLPLDAHPELGNNAQLAKRLGFVVEGSLHPEGARGVGNKGRLEKPLPLQDFVCLVEGVLGRPPQYISGGDHSVSSIGWCTGAADSYITTAGTQGLSAYLSGEISEPTVHIARETGVHYIAAGHHATERFGVQALGDFLAGELGIEHQFIDIDNPV